MFGHRRGDDALHQLLAPGVDDGETHSPNRVANDSHSNQAGNQESDVTRSWFAHDLVGPGNRLLAAGSTLDGLIGQHPRLTTFGVGVIVTVQQIAVRARLGYQSDLSGSNELFGQLRRQLRNVQKL